MNDSGRQLGPRGQLAVRLYLGVGFAAFGLLAALAPHPSGPYGPDSPARDWIPVGIGFVLLGGLILGFTWRDRANHASQSGFAGLDRLARSPMGEVAARLWVGSVAVLLGGFIVLSPHAPGAGLAGWPVFWTAIGLVAVASGAVFLASAVRRLWSMKR